jgi:hypothetical protein
MNLPYPHPLRIAARLLAIHSFAVAHVSATMITSFSFESSPQAWVGRGQSLSVTPEDGYLFQVNDTGSNLFSMRIYTPNSPFGPEWNPGSGQPYDYWQIELKAPGADPLAPGLYENALRYPFQGIDHPGLTFSGNHRGNNRNAGFFEIFAIGFRPDGDISMIDASFTQFGEEQPTQWSVGTVRYNFDPSPPPPVAVADSGSTALALGLALVSLGGLSRLTRRVGVAATRQSRA